MILANVAIADFDGAYFLGVNKWINATSGKRTKLLAVDVNDYSRPFNFI